MFGKRHWIIFRPPNFHVAASVLLFRNFIPNNITSFRSIYRRHNPLYDIKSFFPDDFFPHGISGKLCIYLLFFEQSASLNVKHGLFDKKLISLIVFSQRFRRFVLLENNHVPWEIRGKCGFIHYFFHSVCCIKRYSRSLNFPIDSHSSSKRNILPDTIRSYHINMTKFVIFKKY